MPPIKPARESNYHDFMRSAYSRSADRLCRRIASVTDPVERAIIKQAIKRHRRRQRWHEEHARDAAWVALLPLEVVELTRRAVETHGAERYALLAQAGHVLQRVRAEREAQP
jgi:hypothetical protein